jgi:acylphosphatase
MGRLSWVRPFTLDEPQGGGAVEARRTVQVRIEGRVHGVGYRAFVEMRASEIGLEGWVRNRRDGSVEAVLQGPEEAVAAMLDLCRQGPPDAHVTRVEVIGEGVGAFRGFEVRPTV